MAAWEALAAQPALEKIDEGKPVSVAELRAGIGAIRRSTGWVESARYVKSLGTLELWLYQVLPSTDPERVALLTASERDFVNGLAANPVDGLIWYRLAQVHQYRGNARSVVASLMQSVDMAPNFRPVWVGRTLGLILYRPLLTPEEFQVATSQIRSFWRAADSPDRKVLFGYLRSDGGARAAVEAVVKEDPDAKANYEAIKATFPPSGK